MDWFNIFKRSNKVVQNKPHTPHISIFKQYSGICVEVSNEYNVLLFVAHFTVISHESIILNQITEFDWTPDVVDEYTNQVQEYLKVNIRGYHEELKKAVYIDGYLKKQSDNIWEVHSPNLIKIVNDRAFYRVDVDLDASVILMVANKLDEKSCRVTNISIGGVNLISEEVYEKGDNLLLSIKLLSEVAEIRVCATVVRISHKNGHYEYGCRFIDISDDAQNYIAKNIFKLQIQTRK